MPVIKTIVKPQKPNVKPGRFLASRRAGGIAHDVKSTGRTLITSARRGESRRVLRANSIPSKSIRVLGKTGIVAIERRQGGHALMPSLEGSLVSNGSLLGVVLGVKGAQMEISIRFQRDKSNFKKTDKRKLVVTADAEGITGWNSVGIALG